MSSLTKKQNGDKMKTILMVRRKIDEYDYLARLNGLSVRRIEEKATSAYLSAYSHREIRENGRKRAAYYDLLLEQGRLPTFKLSVHEMERLLPKEVTVQVAQDLKKRRSDLMQSAILK